MHQAFLKTGDSFKRDFTILRKSREWFRLLNVSRSFSVSLSHTDSFVDTQEAQIYVVPQPQKDSPTKESRFGIRSENRS